MSDETPEREQSERLHMRISPEELIAIDDWRFANRVNTRSEAVRRLLQIGIRSQMHLEGMVTSVWELADRIDSLAEKIGSLKFDPAKSDKYPAEVTEVLYKNFAEILEFNSEASNRAVAFVEEVGEIHDNPDLDDAIRRADELRTMYQDRLTAFLENKQKVIAEHRDEIEAFERKAEELRK